MRIHEIILESEEPAKIRAVDALSDIEQASDDAIDFFKSLDKKGVEIDIDNLKQLDEDWKSKLKIAAVGGVLGLTSLLANAGQDPQSFGNLMAKCSAVNYIAAETASDAGAPNSLVKEFQQAFSKTTKIGKQLLGENKFEAAFQQQTDNLIKKYDNGTGKVNTVNLIKDLQIQSGTCDALIEAGKNSSASKNNSASAQDNGQYSPQQIAKYWSDVKDYKGGKSKSGLPDGKGSISWSDGSTYVGNFDNGSLSGEGVMTYPSGAKFDGIFSNGGNMERGTYTWKSGDKFVGEFSTDGKPYNGMSYDPAGKPIYKFEDGKKIEAPKSASQPKTNSISDPIRVLQSKQTYLKNQIASATRDMEMYSKMSKRAGDQASKNAEKFANSIKQYQNELEEVNLKLKSAR